MNAIAAFTTHVREHLPSNSHPELQNEMRHDVLDSLDRFQHARGDTVSERLDDLRTRANRRADLSDKLFWGTNLVGFATCPLWGAMLGIAPAVPLVALALWGLSVPAALLIGRSGDRLEHAANTLHPYAAEWAG